MRIPVTLVIEMTDEQVKAYAAEYGLPFHGGPLRAKDVVEDVRDNVVVSIQGYFGDFAAVSIKR